MKMKRTKLEKEQGEAHTVPLPTQAVALLLSIHPLTGHGRHVFPGERSHDRPVSDNSVRNFDPLAIEANLAHAVKDANGRSYNGTQHL